jgi:hypothetical protein
MSKMTECGTADLETVHAICAHVPCNQSDSVSVVIPPSSHLDWAHHHEPATLTEDRIAERLHCWKQADGRQHAGSCQCIIRPELPGVDSRPLLAPNTVSGA